MINLLLYRISEKMRLNHVSLDEEPDRILYVYKPGVIIGIPTKRKVVREELKQVSNTPVPKSRLVETVIAKKKQPEPAQLKKRGRKQKAQQTQQQPEEQDASQQETRYLLRSRKKIA